MSNKYFRLMKTPDTPWKPYCEVPILEERPDLGTYKSTTYVTEPQKGDYLVQSEYGSMYLHRPSYPELFENAEFDAMPSLQELKSKGIVLEVPAQIARKEFYLQEKRSDLALEIHGAEQHMEDLEKESLQRRFGFPTREAREAKARLEALKPVLLNMYSQFGELGSQLHHAVLTPLKQLQKEQKKTEHLDVKIHRAQSLAQNQQDNTKGLTNGKETEHDR